jgi:endonuclease/exonuclease/phosphatase family metal-dependent hydrolase
MTLNIIGLLGLLGCYAGYYLNPFDYWFISLLGLSYFIWVALNVVFMVAWIFLKWKYALISLVALAIGFPLHTKMITVHSPNLSKGGIRVMSYNVQLFKFYDWKKNEKMRDRILNFIEDTPADIYCFQEYFQTRDDVFTTTPKLKNILPDHYMHFEPGVIKSDNEEYGIATFSKYPIVHSGYLLIDSTSNRTNLVIYSDLLVEKDTIRIYNVHLASNHLNTNEVDTLMKTSGKSVSIAKKWVKKLKNGYKRRYGQVNILAEHLEKCKYPCIIAGDFNDVPISYTYRKMNAKFTDSFTEAGNGIGATYNGNLPLLRIDYIFHSSHFKCKRFKVHSISVTDHFPLVADLHLVN